MGFFSNLKDKIKNEFKFTNKIKTLLSRQEDSHEFLESLEEELINADMSMELTLPLVKNIKEKIKKEFLQKEEIYQCLKKELSEILPETPEYDTSKDLHIILVLGVNGSGKTTSIAKIANYYKNKKKRILLAAADTFRAAAVDQLSTWAERGGIDLVKKHEGADPGSVVFEALDQALTSENYDVLIIDTAGRLHTKKNLIEELVKMNKIIEKQLAQTSKSVSLQKLLVLDATSGNNALLQARHFAQAVGVDGLVLAKLDSSAKGGFVFSITHELKIPIQFLGVGETVKDLLLFNKTEFLNTLFDE